MENFVKFHLSKKQTIVLLLAIIVALLLAQGIIQQSPEDIEEKITFPEIEERMLPLSEPPRIEPPQEEKTSLGGYIRASFTDVFSGTGWLDGQFTNLYFGYRAKKLLFPPKLVIREILPDGLLDSFSVSSVFSQDKNIYFLGKHRLTGEEQIISWQLETNKWEVNNVSLAEIEPKKTISPYQGKVNKVNDKWLFEVYKGEKKLFTKESDYEGNLNIGQCGENVLVVFSSYFSQAVEITPQEEIKDKTEHFGWRVSEKGEKIYEGFPCYLKNSDGSIIRWDGQFPLEISKFFRLTYQPSFLEMVKVDNQWYLICGVPDGGTKVYQFFDQGFDLENYRQVVSKKINFDVPEIKAAMIEKASFGGPGEFEFFLSNNGGETWQKAKPGDVVYFESKGNDLRWASRINPLNQESLQSPYLDSIFIKYWYTRT